MGHSLIITDYLLRGLSVVGAFRVFALLGPITWNMLRVDGDDGEDPEPDLHVVPSVSANPLLDTHDWPPV